MSFFFLVCTRPKFPQLCFTRNFIYINKKMFFIRLRIWCFLWFFSSAIYSSIFFVCMGKGLEKIVFLDKKRLVFLCYSLLCGWRFQHIYLKIICIVIERKKCVTLKLMKEFLVCLIDIWHMFLFFLGLFEILRKYFPTLSIFCNWNTVWSLILLCAL